MLLFSYKRELGIKMRIRLTYLEIETCNLCNRRCQWCLFGQHPDFRGRTFILLDTNYLNKIFYELKENDFKGVISFHSMNEPLLDERITNGSLFKQCRNIIGKDVILKVTTNGDLLNNNIVETMFYSGMNHLYVSCYSKEVLQRVCELQQIFTKISILDFSDKNKDKLIFNRAGSIQSNYISENKKSCMLPLYTTVIGFDGEVRICCNDATGQLKFGNIKSHALYEILNSEEMKKIRNKICLNRYNVFPCNVCNFDDKCDPYLNPIEFSKQNISI